MNSPFILVLICTGGNRTFQRTFSILSGAQPCYLVCLMYEVADKKWMWDIRSCVALSSGMKPKIDPWIRAGINPHTGQLKNPEAVNKLSQ